MKRTHKRSFIAAAIAALLTLPAQAEANCGPRQNVVEQLTEKYGEAPYVRGLAASPPNTPTNASPPMVELWVSEVTGTWTFVVTTPTGMSCVPASGGSMQLLELPAPAEGDPT